MGMLMDEILSSAPEDIKSAPEEVKVAYTTLLIGTQFDLPLEDMIWISKDLAGEKKEYNRYTTYAKHLNNFLKHLNTTLREKNDSPLNCLAYLAKLLECYSIAKAYDSSEEVRRAVEAIEGDPRVPRDVRDFMREIMNDRIRKMLYNVVDSVLIRPLSLYSGSEKDRMIKEVNDRLNKLVSYAEVSLTAFGKLVSGELEGKVESYIYNHLVNEHISGNVLNFGWEVKDEELYSLENINKRGEYRRPTHEDWAYQVKNLYNIAKKNMGVCAEILEKYVGEKPVAVTP